MTTTSYSQADQTVASPDLAVQHRHRRHRRWMPGMIAAAIVAVQALFALCLGYPLLHAAPHEVPLGIAGPPAAVSQLSARLESQHGAFDVRRFSGPAAARAAIRDRDVDGALVVSPRGPQLLVASASGADLSGLLTTEAQGLGGHHPVPVTDLVPAPQRDPQEVGALATLLPLILISLALGAALAHAERRARRRLGWCAAASLVAGLGVCGVAAGLGTFTGSYWADAGVLALLVFGLSSTSSGLVSARALRPLEGLFALTMICLGIPSSGALVPAALLAEPWRTVGPYLPPAAALDALRGITFFGGAATAGPLAVLACWSVLGVLLVAAGSASTRASERRRSLVSSGLVGSAEV
jgi:hypothetical protein